MADYHADEDNLEEWLHSAVYFGSVAVGSNASAAPDNESDNNSSDSSPSDDSTPVNVSRGYAKEAGEKMLSQITDAPAASAIAIDKGITALANSVMKELQKFKNQGTFLPSEVSY
ncbi:MAG: hypothetical protein K2N44_11655 [Lachnospiraceae bacterium]|nr:hypothetical protein [Lachnospiraceae bacterium]